MTATEIIYNALTLVHSESHDGVFFCDEYLMDMAQDCVNDIREEFRKSGVDVWKGVKNENKTTPF